MAVKFIRLVAVITQLTIIFGGSIVFAAVGELDVKFSYPSRYAPPLSLTKFPGGISAIQPEAYIFEFKKVKRTWSIKISSDNDYVMMSLKAGLNDLYHPIAIQFDNYIAYSVKNTLTETWIHDMATFSGIKGKDDKSFGVEFKIPIKVPKPVRSIIGEGGPRITVTGSRRISFSGRSEWDDDVVNTGTFKQSKFPSLNMEQSSKFKIRGDIGSKIYIEVDQDSNRDIELANTMKLRYKGEEDEIIQTIEAGNTNLRLPNSQFIGYSQNVQGLFGIKATAQLGNVELTMITSQEKGSSEKTTFTQGSQVQPRTIWDYDYLHRTYFWLRDRSEISAGDSLIDVRLYVIGTERDTYGKACVDPHFGPGSDETGGEDTLYYVSDEELNRGEFEERYFVELPVTEYEYYASSWYIVLNSSLGKDAVLGVYYKYIRNNNGIVDTLQEGDIISDTLILKLLYDPEIVDASFTTWKLEWKNVYYLGSTNLSPEGFELQIYKGNGNMETDTLDQDNTPYIEWFGFDEHNNSNPDDNTPDGFFDFNSQRDINAAKGHLIFHQDLPFTVDFLHTKNPEIYYDQSQPQQYKKYYIWVKSAKRENSFYLNKPNIIENSEVVKLSNGTVLQNGSDYTINYDIGQITFISDRATNPTADISIDFEYAPFFMPEKKTLYGISARYIINDKSSVSLSGMFRKETSRNYRPRVGQEPRQSMIWDSNFILHFDPEFLSNAVDALPLIETDAPSMFEISGEVAQSFPNPNIYDDAYIDDFEGVKEYSDLIMRRSIWTMASPPLNMNYNDRRKMYWYNPYDAYNITDIWPNKDVRDQDNKQDVLVLHYIPDSCATSFDTSSADWAGIMRSMYSGASDQSQKKFIEIWYLPQANAVQHPILYIDAGKISEDIDEDGIWDTEDENSNGILDTDEDVGLDGMNNEEERTAIPDSSLWISKSSDDPSGDNWNYNSQGAEKYDYSQINGTDSSRTDPDRLNRIDTEDINNNKSLDLANSYFQYRVDLNDPLFFDAETDSGWRLLRIPFQDSTVYQTFGNPDFTAIKFIRIWMTGVSDPYQLKFASIQLVGNKWRELGSPEQVYIGGRPMDTKFEVTVKNTAEDSLSGYVSPPDVIRHKDEFQTLEKEQSLVLRYENLYPGQKVAAYLYLTKTEDYTLYNKMKMFVHGDSHLADNDVPLYLYFRMGTDSISNFYEYKTKLYSGWSEENYVEFDFAKLTGLKNEVHSQNPDSIALADTIDSHYRVKGNPSLSQIQMIVIGLELDKYRADSTRVPMIPISGEVWCDELRLTDIRRESDFAGRIKAQISFADLADITANYERKGADFFPLNAKKAAGYLRIFQSINGRFQFHKLVPPSWGLSLPLSLSWQKDKNLPRLKSGSDIILTEEQRQEEITQNKSWSASASQRFNRSTNNWLWNWTLNRIDTRYVYSQKDGFSPTKPITTSTTYEISGKYDLTPKAKPFFKPFYWTQLMFLPKSIYDIQFYFLPTALRYDSKVNSTKSYEKDKGDNETSRYIRDLVINQTYGMMAFSALKTDFSISSNRDINNPNSLYFSYDPREIKLGRERTYTQKFTNSFTPSLTRQVKPRIQFSATYSENSDIAQNQDSTRTTLLNTNLRADLNLDVIQFLGIKKLLGKIIGESEPGERGNRRGDSDKPDIKDKDKHPEEEEKDIPAMKDEDVPDVDKGEGETEEEEGEEEKGEEEDENGGMKIPNPLVILKKPLYLLTIIKPFQGSYFTDKRFNRAGLYDRPSWNYTLGLTDVIDVRRTEIEGFGADQTTTSDDYSVRSGIEPFRSLDITTSYKVHITENRSSNAPTGSKSLDFPNVSATLSGVEKFPLIKALVKSASIQTGYARKVDENGNPDTDIMNSRATSKTYSPLLGLNLTFNKGVRGTIRYDQTKRKSEDLRLEGGNQRVDYSDDRTIKVSISYSLTAPQGLKLPFFSRVKFDSQLTMSLDLMKMYKKSWYIKDGSMTVERNSIETSIEPKLSYRFSTKITGGLNARWIDSDDISQQRKRHVRELGIWTELRF